MASSRTAIRLVAITVALAVESLSPAPAQAGYTLYTSAASYQAATTGNTTVNFNGLAATGGFTPEPVPPGLTVGGVNFTINQATSNGQLFVINQLGPHYGTLPVVSSQASTSGDNNLVVSLPGIYTSFAIDGNAFINNAGTFGANPITLTLSNGISFSVTLPSDGTYGFIGLSSTVAFQSIAITDSNNIGQGVINLADLTYGTAAVPEPSSLTLVALGLASYLGYRRRLGWLSRRPSDSR